MGLILSYYQYPVVIGEKVKDVTSIQLHKTEGKKGREEVNVLDIQIATAGSSFREKISIGHEKLCLVNRSSQPSIIGLGDITAIEDEEDGKQNEIAEYCLPLTVLHFSGQTSSLDDKGSDRECKSDKLLTLKHYLQMMDKFIRQHKVITQLTGEEEEYCAIMMLIATQRYCENEESIQDCYKRLMSDSKRFVKIYHKRGELSEACETDTYWGSRQQLLSGKVIADWVDQETGPLDPIFGVLLRPTSGRVGSGDAGLIHYILFDGNGPIAFHSAVHDAFGYLKAHHDTGPGYNYLNKSSYFHTNDTNSPLAGQLPGIAFWKKVIREVMIKQKVLRKFSV